MMHFARIATLNYQTNLCALLFTNEVMMHRACEQQRWDRSKDFVRVSVRDHDDAGTVINCLTCGRACCIKRIAQSLFSIGNPIQATYYNRLQLWIRIVIVDMNNFCKMIVVDNWKRQHKLSTMLWACLEQVALWAHCSTN